MDDCMPTNINAELRALVGETVLIFCYVSTTSSMILRGVLVDAGDKFQVNTMLAESGVINSMYAHTYFTAADVAKIVPGMTTTQIIIGKLDGCEDHA